MATLDIETAPFQDDDIILTKVEMQYSGGTIEDLCSEQILKLPKTCRPKDHLAFLYRLHHNGELMHRDNTSSYSKSMTVVIEANVLVSETCKPKIQMKWKSNVDFSAPLNPSFVAPGQTMQRSKRPPSLPVTASNKSQSDPPQLSNAASSVEIGQQRHRAISTGHIGVTMTLTAPRDVYVGEPFTWDVFIVNGSSKPRKLAIVVIPKRSLADVKSHLAKRSSSSSASGRRGELELADATMDENRLYAMQKSAGREEVQIVSLSTEVRLGTLNPGFCHNAELKFLPLASGVLHIETIRVIDLVANESIDVRDLPEIVADDRNGNSRILGGIADTVAQSLTAIRSRQKRPLLGTAISDGIEMPDYDEKGVYNAEFRSPRRRGPPPFDFERLTRFMSYGFIISPAQYHWFAFLARTFPVTKESATLPALQRVGFDQFIFAPFGLACFFTFMTVTEGGGRRAVTRKFQDPFVSTVGIAWTAYLSLTNSSDDSPV
ncbi:MAG: hypothetical protein LQ342_002312 [Letrouitia transgressa]|nr:MAG: hypothetical protein LQ342_002312 [Letrouitia transgressa]